MLAVEHSPWRVRTAPETTQNDARRFFDARVDRASRVLATRRGRDPGAPRSSARATPTHSWDRACESLLRDERVHLVIKRSRTSRTAQRSSITYVDRASSLVFQISRVGKTARLARFPLR